MQKTMKALYVKSRGNMIMREMPIPEPGPGEVLVRVNSCGICHTDVNSRTGFSKRESYEFVPGHEFSGTVAALGPGVRNLGVGTRGVVHQIIGCGSCASCARGMPLHCERYYELGNGYDGGFAEYVAVPERFFLPIPDHMSFERACLVEPLANATWATVCADILPGDRVVVIGPGPIGLMAVKIASLMRPEMLVLVGTRDTRLEMGRLYGATHTVNIRNEGAEKLLLEEILEGKGADVVIDASGSLSGFELGLSMAKKGTRISIEGSLSEDDYIELYPRSFKSNSSIRFISAWRTIDFINALDMIKNSQIDVDPLITHVLPFSKWEEGFDHATHNKNKAIKVILKIEREE